MAAMRAGQIPGPRARDPSPRACRRARRIRPPARPAARRDQGHRRVLTGMADAGHPILQFGTSRFLQAHVDLFVSEASQSGQALGGITVVQTTGNPASSARLRAIARPQGFDIIVRGLVGGQPVTMHKTCRSVRAALTRARTGRSCANRCEAQCAWWCRTQATPAGRSTPPTARHGWPPLRRRRSRSRPSCSCCCTTAGVPNPTPRSRCCRASSCRATASNCAARGGTRRRMVVPDAVHRLAARPRGVGELARRSHRLRGTRTGGRGGRALRAVGGRAAAAARVALHAPRHRADRRAGALRTAQAVPAQPRAHAAGDTNGCTAAKPPT